MEWAVSLAIMLEERRTGKVFSVGEPAGIPVGEFYKEVEGGSFLGGTEPGKDRLDLELIAVTRCSVEGRGGGPVEELTSRDVDI